MKRRRRGVESNQPLRWVMNVICEVRGFGGLLLFDGVQSWRRMNMSSSSVESSDVGFTGGGARKGWEQDLDNGGKLGLSYNADDEEVINKIVQLERKDNGRFEEIGGGDAI
ncbi:hypothetical protein F0562_029508 [Nyssa sinensis]|uniref:Uncharacterized protein n=1 Tax=Nyssa sinensis TaxID=561372 RepID=A0A5J5B392_9ASTE|nr:hypothetical protein F0562_029508 [Nyssa sinensis]